VPRHEYTFNFLTAMYGLRFSIAISASSKLEKILVQWFVTKHDTAGIRTAQTEVN
jgi:hypothetical protein